MNRLNITVIFNKTVFLSTNLIRNRHQVDPGILQERLLLEVTKPVLRKRPSDMKIDGSIKAGKKKPLGNYAEFLVEKCRQEIFGGAAEGRAVLVFQMNYCKHRDRIEMESELFERGGGSGGGIEYFYYPNRVMELAGRGTRLERLVEALYRPFLANMTLVCPGDPGTCSVALETVGRTRRMMLLGGAIEYRFMDCKQLADYVALGSIDEVRGALLGQLQLAGGADTSCALEWHLGELSALLGRYSATGGGA